MNIVKIICLASFLNVLPIMVAAQQFQFRIDDKDGIAPRVYAERRLRLIDSLPSGGVAVILSADVRNRQNDVDYEYRQNSDLLYLTGIPYPHCMLILTKEALVVNGKPTNQIFLIRTRNTDREQWSGVTAGPKEAEELYQLTPSLPYDSVVWVMNTLFRSEETGQTSDGAQVTSTKQLRNHTLMLSGWSTRAVGMPLLGKNLYVDSEVKKGLLTKYGITEVVTPIPALATMRMIKDTAELRLMRKAIDITIQGHIEAMKAARHAKHEYEIEAVMEYAFKRLGAEDVGYPSIVGSNYNACILHYTTNRREMNTGNLVLADCGAEYHGYTADITRTFPTNGTFTAGQRIIYQLVLEAQDSGIAACRAHAAFKDPHNAALSVIRRGLTDLGIITEPTQVKQYFMHGTSHYLGLDVHDAGNRGPLLPNTVITVEPGIYIAANSPCDSKWWNIGVRIEDDILITEGKPEVLSAKLPRTVESIEDLLRSK